MDNTSNGSRDGTTRHGPRGPDMARFGAPTTCGERPTTLPRLNDRGNIHVTSVHSLQILVNSFLRIADEHAQQQNAKLPSKATSKTKSSPRKISFSGMVKGPSQRSVSARRYSRSNRGFRGRSPAPRICPVVRFPTPKPQKFLTLLSCPTLSGNARLETEHFNFIRWVLNGRTVPITPSDLPEPYKTD